MRLVIPALQTRQDLASQELAQRMMALTSPEATRDSLAYNLTDDELAAFDAFQARQLIIQSTTPAVSVQQ